MRRGRWLFVVIAAACAAVAGAGGSATPARAAGGHAQALCIGHHPQDFVWYT